MFICHQLKLRSCRLALTLLLVCSSLIGRAQLQSLGSPLVQNFTKSQYHSGNKNWAVAKDARGVMYFGNSEGLLVYDRSSWQLYPTQNHLIIRSVACDGGKVYTGAYGEFGYWQYHSDGKFKYTSLISLLGTRNKLEDEIWKIYVDGDRILFQSFSAIYIYRAGKIKVVKSPNPYLFLLKANGHFFLQIHHQGLYELVGDKLELLPGTEFLGDSHVLSVLPYHDDGYLIGTSNLGIFTYIDKKIAPWNVPASNLLKTGLLNNGCRIMGKYYAYGTILNGVIILNDAGEIVQHINKASGLQNNTVLSLYNDDEQNLWAGLDNGIDRIELNSPLSYYFDKTGKFGTIYASAVFNGYIYLGTNQGIFYSKWYGLGNMAFLSLNFELIPNSQGQVWNLFPIDGQLLCGHNDATFRIEKNTLVKLSDVKGGWTMKELPYNPDYLIQGTYNGLAIYKKQANGQWLFDHRIAGFTRPSRYVEQDAKRQIWVSHAYKGVSKLVLDKDLQRVISHKEYGQSSGLPSDYNINIFNVDNRILFSSNSGFYIYDDITDRFTPYSDLNNKLGNFSTSNRVIRATGNHYWFINHGKVAFCTIDPGHVTIDSSQFSSLKDHMVQLYENVSQINDNIYLISIDDGFAVFDTHNTGRFDFELPPLLIRRITDITASTNTFTEDANAKQDLEIPYAHDNIRIEYTLPYYRQGRITYQYFLEGYTTQWSEWSPETQKDFTNLNAGYYTFKVRARINDGTVFREAEFKFRVLSPWYASIWAFIVYIALFGLLIWGAFRFYKFKLARQHQLLEARLQAEAAETLRKEALANEQKIIVMKNEQLQADLSSKNKQLASSAMNVVYKNEHLQKIKDGLLKLRKTARGLTNDENTELKKVIKLIDIGMDEDRDWHVFENSFNEAHIDFLKKLKSEHSSLLPTDLKLCAYLRMNMSSKEIASLLKISVRGVEIRRYRLRKKLNLDHDRNLVEFLMGL